MGRPKKVIDETLVEQLAKIGCPYSEIAAIVGCSKSLLSTRFKTIIANGHDNLKMSIRRMQMKSAQAGNIAMQIWLGKQYLGQQDKQAVEIAEVDIYKDPLEMVFRGRTVSNPTGNGHPAGGSNGHSNGNGHA